MCVQVCEEVINHLGAELAGFQPPLLQEPAQPLGQPHLHHCCGRRVPQGFRPASQASRPRGQRSFHCHFLPPIGNTEGRSIASAGAAIMRIRPGERTTAASGSMAFGGLGAAYSRPPHKRPRWISVTCSSSWPAIWPSATCSPTACRSPARPATGCMPARLRKRSWKGTWRRSPSSGVPWRHVRYDNLSPAAAKVLAGRSRTETARWLSFRSWYGFSAFYCEPGQAGAHEKGGVEGEIGRFRRRWMVPVPKVSSLAELNARLAEADAAEDARHIAYRAATVGEDFAAEAPLLAPLPAEPFDCAATAWPRVDRYARISLGKCRYSVPARLIDTRARVRLSANELRIFDGSQQVAAHPRLAAAGAEHLELDHYLEILARKPGALAGSAALAQARASGAFTSVHDAFWAAARARRGDGAGARALIEVLLLHRRMAPSQVIAGMQAALAAGSCSADVVAVEARKHAAAASPAEAGTAWQALERPRRSRAAVITLPRRPAPALPPDRRPAPSVAAYDQLLRNPPSAGGTR